MNLKKILNDTLSFMSEHDRVIFIYHNILLKNSDDSFDLHKVTFNTLFSSDLENSDIFDTSSDNTRDVNDFLAFMDENDESFDVFAYSDEELESILDEEGEELGLIDSKGDIQAEVLINGNTLVIFSNLEKDIESYIYNYCFLDGYIFTKMLDSDVDNIKSMDVVTGYKYKKIIKVHGKLENDICYN